MSEPFPNSRPLTIMEAAREECPDPWFCGQWPDCECAPMACEVKAVINDDPLATARGCVNGLIGSAVIIALGLLAWWFFGPTEAKAHNWFPAQCCNGGDCRVITQEQVMMTRKGILFPGNPEYVPYDSPKIKETPPEGEGAYAICTRGGVQSAPIICVYIPTWGT